MLVLSRKRNESIVIDENITIVVVEIRGDKVRLGVEAPKDVPVHRREVYDAIKRNEQREPKEPDKPAVCPACGSRWISQVYNQHCDICEQEKVKAKT